MSLYLSWLRKYNLTYYFSTLSGIFSIFIISSPLFSKSTCLPYILKPVSFRGGPSYKDSEKLRLTISDVSMEAFVLSVFSDYPSVSMVALKLPTNYDNDYLEVFARSNGFTYQFFDSFRKMTLTILKRARTGV